jgi:hypothetical protein
MIDLEPQSSHYTREGGMNSGIIKHNKHRVTLSYHLVQGCLQTRKFESYVMTSLQKGQPREEDWYMWECRL